MRTRLLDLLALAFAAGLIALSLRPAAPPPTSPPPTPPLAPAPAPPPKPWGEIPAAPVGALIAGPRHPDGTEVQCDLPGELHVRNRGGKDGVGLCVFASLRHSGLWHDEPVLTALFEWMFTRPGGGYPAKVDATIAAYCKDKAVPPPAYLQLEGGDLDLLRRACAAGRMPAVTYWYSPTGRYGGKRVSHMVSLLAAGAGRGPDGKGWWVVLDNNHPGPDKLEWMSEAQFRKCFTGGAAGWAVVPLRAGPPPVPRNLSPASRTAMLPLCTAALLTLPPPTTPAPANFGIDRDKLAAGERYTLNGRAASRADAVQAVGRPALPDDAGLRRLVVIGPRELRARVVADVNAHPALAPWRGKLVLTDHDPGHWHVARVGFVTAGRPTVYVQAADGRVLHRQDDYDDGPEGLAAALRRIDPQYRPEADVDLRKTAAPAPLSLPALPWSAWALAGAAVLLYVFGGKKT